MKTRIIHTRFWEDSFVCDLSHKEKLTFLYLLTNARIGLTGIYELPDKFILLDLELTKEELEKAKKKLQESDKIYFIGGYVAIKNAKKYNDYSKGNDNQVKAYYKEIGMLPDVVKSRLVDYGFELVSNSIPTSPQLVTQLDIIHKTKTINNKSEIRNQKLEHEEIENELLQKRQELFKKMGWKYSVKK